MSSKLRIIVTGVIAQHPCLGGVAWDYVQYAAGLSRLGHDVYYFEDNGEWPYKTEGGKTREDWIAFDCEPNIRHLSNVMSRFGLEGKWAYHCPVQPKWFGLSAKKRREVLKSADVVLNVSGTLQRPEDYRSVPRLVYIDSDPVFTQIKLNLSRGQRKFQRRVKAHDIHFSFGEALSEPLLETGRPWLPTRTPILLSEWRPSEPSRDIFTTVMNWTSYKPLKYQSKIYGQKDLEFAKFMDLPRLARPALLEVALNKPGHSDWQTQGIDLPQATLDFLRSHPEWTPGDLLKLMGWNVISAIKTCADLDSYRAYIESSKAEWSVAKNAYVRGMPGWFSCRSACYLAAGKPVIVQDTGFGKVLPVGKGILTFTNVEEAVQAIQEVNGNYGEHSKAARQIAEEYFDSDKVLSRLIDKAMASHLKSVSASGEPCRVS